MTPETTTETTPEQAAKNKIEKTLKALLDAALEYMLAESGYGKIKPELGFGQIMDNIKTTMDRIMMCYDLAVLNAIIGAAKEAKEMKDQEGKESAK